MDEKQTVTIDLTAADIVALSYRLTACLESARMRGDDLEQSVLERLIDASKNGALQS